MFLRTHCGVVLGVLGLAATNYTTSTATPMQEQRQQNKGTEQLWESLKRITCAFQD